MSMSGAGEWELEVLSVTDVTPHFRRIAFHAPGFYDGAVPVEFSAASWIRLWVPDEADPGREHQRAYTVVESDPEAERLTLEFVLHEPAGPASTWARRATVGSRIVATRFGLQEFSPPDPPAAGYLLVGDASGIPGINGILEALPKDVPVDVYLEHAHADDREIPIAAHPRRRLTWVPRTGEAAALADALAERDYDGWFAWVTCERGAVRAVRERLKQWGFPRGSVKSQAYWAVGKGARRGAEAPAGPPPAAAPMTIEPDAGADIAAPAGSMAVDKRASGWAATAGRRLLAPIRPLLLLAGVAQALVTLLQIAPYVVLAEVCRRVLAGETGDLGGLAWTAAALMAAGSLLSIALVAALHLLDAELGDRIRRRLVGHLGRLPLGWFDDRSSGIVRKVVQDDAAQLHYLVTHAVLDAVAAVVAPVAVLAYLFVVHPGLAGVLLVPLLLLYVLILRVLAVAGDGRPVFERFRERVGAEAVALTDGAAVVRIYDVGPDSRFRRLLADRMRFFDQWQGPLTEPKARQDLVTRPTTSMLLIAGVGGAFVIAGWMAPHELVVFLFVGVTFGSQLLAISYGIVALYESQKAAGRIGLLLEERELPVPDGADAAPTSSAPAPRGRVRFEGVTFGYRADRPIVRDLDLALEPGTLTAIVGSSGAGKSTLASLLARFYDVDAGRITIDGDDLRSLAPAELHRRVGFVLQGGAPVRASLRDNIALARPEATAAEIERAARSAQIHERIVRDPRGYDAVLGEETWLSGGELQRLAVARTLLADPPVLVLDEATAFADPESEHLVQQAITALAAERTVLAIAHRLPTIVHADRIVVLERGSIAEQGTHAELLGARGRYHAMWEAWSASHVPARLDARTPA
ncbi:ATP-binding cassette domain-containing protein [Patulibacter brassicae]|uniref:Mycobactin import ATP-binding/permease protein IrtA n=1 Tax=Patulibacter brassicae TaxID=1705717 RepID=A0ABU4VGH7_9ACTN|nr:SIP domain-containing protein [Patulibacter brassicae]MDX8150921.1 ATP-binding cassette domain-containing protein [Patulibacter brassicae]